MRIFLTLVILVPLSMAGAVYLLFFLWGDELPSPRTLRELEPSVNSVVLDRRGEVIGEFFVENRSTISLQEMPEQIREAILATEDTRFYRHWGWDLQGIVRAFGTNLLSGGIEQGASTITQQLARKLFLSDSQTIERKLKEAVLAIRLERSFSKDEILELYLNKIYFGDGAYGVEAAAQTYFGKPAHDLDLEECALLAGVIANPAAFSPSRKPDRARQRRNLVLRRMEQAGAIDSLTRAAAETTAVVLHAGGGRTTSRAPYFTESVRRELAERYGDDAVYSGGLTIHTTLDLRLQEAASEAMEKQIAAVEKQQAHRFAYLREEGKSMGHLQNPEQGTPYLQGALIAVEPQTGAIRAMFGGRSFAESKFNRATQALRQPGSAFKPIIFTLAVMDGHRPNEILLDTPLSYDVPGPGNRITNWSPKNFDLQFRGPVTLRYALMKSINIPAVRLLEQEEPRRAIELAHGMGIDRPLPPYLSLALGTGELTPLEITSAYGIFANQGIYQEPYLIDRVENRYGHLLEEHSPHSREVVDERTAGIMVSLLRSVMDHGTGAPARYKHGFRAPAAGKTGTTDDYSDAWFVGASPRITVGV
ncbi:MAG: PBP1A family penicillin-binding protein, partial [Candidatus Eisenbacteria bacterium]|nr:PBP1A family penicillin-binding protein [Candidatus Eisenbacteria bacterium]